MVGQNKTRRNPDTGRLEKIPEEERAAMIEADAEQAARDKLFLATAHSPTLALCLKAPLARHLLPLPALA